MEVRPSSPADRTWVEEACRRAFGGPGIAVLGRHFTPALLPGLVAWEGGRPAGALAFAEEPGGAQVVMLVADPPGRGAGTALLAALDRLGRERGWERIRLATTNDNTAALRFYQRRGWDLAVLHRGAAARDRALKPEIPPLGHDGIPLRHVLELVRRLSPAQEGSP